MAIQAAIIASENGSNLQLTACLATMVKAVSTSLPSIAVKFGKDLAQVITNIKILNATSS